MGTMIQRRGLPEGDFPRSRRAPPTGPQGQLRRPGPDLPGRPALHPTTPTSGGGRRHRGDQHQEPRDRPREYGAEDTAFEMLNVAAARWAWPARRRPGVDPAHAPDKPRFVAGVGWALNKKRSTALWPSVADPGFRAVTFDQGPALAYAEQVRRSSSRRRDPAVMETIFDTLNAKAALVAIEDVFDALGTRVPVMISVTITDKSGHRSRPDRSRPSGSRSCARPSAVGRRQLRRAQPRCARTSRSSPPSPTRFVSQQFPTPVSSTPSASTTPRRTLRRCSSAAGFDEGLGEHRRRVLRDHAQGPRARHRGRAWRARRCAAATAPGSPDALVGSRSWWGAPT